MRILAAATFTALLATSQPFAQTGDQTIAKLVDMKGSVLVSRESGLATGIESMRVSKGMRVLTTANARVVVQYDDGCRVTLEENQRFLVDDRACAILMTMPQPILVAPVAVASAMTTIAPLILGGATIAAFLDSRNHQQVSPS
jgi:environmental stress-induced protein Ves